MNFVNEIFPETILNQNFTPPILCRQKAFSDRIGYQINYNSNDEVNNEVNIDETVYRSVPVNITRSNNNSVHRRSNSGTNKKFNEINLKRINTF